MFKEIVSYALQIFIGLILIGMSSVLLWIILCLGNSLYHKFIDFIIRKRKK